MVVKYLKSVRSLVVVSLAALIHSGGLSADDTDIYQATPVATGARPQVLVVFDDSESMNDIVADRPPYQSSATYVNVHPSERVYWSTNGRPPSRASNDFVYTANNRCATSIGPLAEQGFFQTKARRWFAGGLDQFCQVVVGAENCIGGVERAAGWWEIISGSITAPHMDCHADIVNSNPVNPGIPDGYPQNSSTDGEEYGPDPDGSLNWGDSAYTFYSAHYMDWYYDDTLDLGSPTKLDIAQQVVSSLVNANTAIDFGLAFFNENSFAGDYDGGRIIQRLIPNMTDGVGGDRASLTALLNGTISSGFTPLCESAMEVYRYLAADDVVYGLEKHPDDDPQPKDDLAEDPAGTYAPPERDCTDIYVILMTDGRPTYDTDANEDIEALTGKTCDDYETGFEDVIEKNCLPELAEYMATHDLDGNETTEGVIARTYTIGFGLDADEPLLADTAASGQGFYYAADNAEQLTAAFQLTILNILSTDTTFTSPAVAVDTFTRTESRNEVFFAMFKPETTVNWPGNVKRLDIDLSTGVAILVDQNRDPGNPAVDPVSGQIRNSASTFWGDADQEDGPAVLEGGAGALLHARNPATRVLYTNTGINDALESYGLDNLDASAYGLENDAALYAYFGVEDALELGEAVVWGAGYDIADEDQDQETAEARWILSDMLHSKPLVINYGARTGAFSRENPDLRIVVGTNSGFLHMFGNDDGQEDWAFFAKELAPVLNKRRLNAVSSEHVYGIDAPVVLYTNDRNKDGSIIISGDADASDEVYLYFGLRRGGRILYAMDVSDPDNPEMLWRIDNTVPGFEELGQTWSVPVVTRIPGYRDDDGVPKPVLIFGAGYDTNKDSPGLATPDAMGRGLFIVDAISGELIWSITPAANSLTNMEEAGLLHSVAATVNVLDSNGDVLTDRIYFADTGGQLWRVDLAGAGLPDINQDTWRLTKIAAVNLGTASTDRRFFNAPDVVRTSYSGVAFDAVLIGSGDRTDPTDVDDPNDPNSPAVNNQFYMFRDQAINLYFTDPPSEADCTADPPSPDFRCQLPLAPADLFNVTSNVIETGEVNEQLTALAELADADGWRFDLQADGEKVLARSLTIGGKVYFPSFQPAAVLENACAPAAGIGRLYVVDLITAIATEDFDSNGNTDRSWIIGSLIPDTPSPHIGSDGEIRLLLPPGSGGQGAIGSPYLTGASIPTPYGSYWYEEEY